MNRHVHAICALSGVIFMLLFLIGWAIFAWPLFPPPAPSLTAEQVVELYTQNTHLLRLGMILLIVSAGFFALFSAEIATRLYKINISSAPLLAFAHLLAGGVNTLFFIIPPVLWGVAAYRPERNPEITQAITDIGWFFFFQPVSLILVQFTTIAYAAFKDYSPQPVFPRWVGYFNVWMIVIFLPSLLLTFFKSGPFAWNGIICFWIPVGAFGPWVGVMMYCLLNRLKDHYE